MIHLFVEGIGVIGPGLESWPASRPILAGRIPHGFAPVQPQPVALLPSAERRRSGTTAKLAIAAGMEALTQSGRDAADMPIVFAASGGDGETIHDTLSVLATEQREVSPTRFHNSVHNAASGYWALAVGSRVQSVSLSAGDKTFTAGLMEAAVQAITGRRAVVLIAYDVPYLQPLHAARPVVAMFGMALVLAHEQSDRALASLAIDPAAPVSPATAMADPSLERLRLGNPAARGLPLLAALARAAGAAVHIDGVALTVAAP